MSSNSYARGCPSMPSGITMPVPATASPAADGYGIPAVTMPQAQPNQSSYAPRYPPLSSAYNAPATQNGFLAAPPMGPYPQTTSTTYVGTSQGLDAHSQSRPPSAMSFNSATVVPSSDGHYRGQQNKPQHTTAGQNDSHGGGCCIIM